MHVIHENLITKVLCILRSQSRPRPSPSLRLNLLRRKPGLSSHSQRNSVWIDGQLDERPEVEYENLEEQCRGIDDRDDQMNNWKGEDCQVEDQEGSISTGNSIMLLGWYEMGFNWPGGDQYSVIEPFRKNYYSGWSSQRRYAIEQMMYAIAVCEQVLV